MHRAAMLLTALLTSTFASPTMVEAATAEKRAIAAAATAVSWATQPGVPRTNSFR